jgi:hypothetical protein
LRIKGNGGIKKIKGDGGIKKRTTWSKLNPSVPFNFGLGARGGTTGQIASRTLGRAVVGGTISDATGGKFANGAVAAAFASLGN